MIKKCFITDSPTKDVLSNDPDGVIYSVQYAKSVFTFQFSWNHSNSSFVENNKHILQGLIINEKFNYDKKNNFYDNERLEKIITEATIPTTPEEKKDNLLLYIHSLQEYEGSPISFTSEIDLVAKRLYFRNYEELVFFIYTLQDENLITIKGTKTIDSTHIRQVKLKYEGLTKVIDITESGHKSKRCFIAMSFSPEVKEIRESIKEVVNQLGYSPILIDEIHYDSEVTINDALIAEIKKCKFMVADFTEHKYGVYFEAGYALGLKRPVIYTCKSTDFSKTHFDTNHYPHIIYANIKELKEKLKNKIEAWII